jgi:glycosyltransferase involved in cell wall biosynthesis
MIEQKATRIAILAPHFPEETLRQAVATGERADVLLIANEERVQREFKDRPLPKSERVKIKNLKFTSVLDPFRVVWSLLRFRPDVLHIHEASGQLRAAICAFATIVMRPRCRIVLSVHDPKPHLGRDTDVVKRIGWLRPFVRRRAHAIIVHGEHCRAEYNEEIKVPGQTVITSLLGTLLADDPSGRPIQEGALHVLAFGRMEKYKGLETLCVAAELLWERRADIRLMVIGGGPELDRLEGRLRNIPSVTVENGFAPAARLVRAFRDVDCVVMPYLSASQSGILTSAFGNQRFVVASRVGGLQDVLEEGVNGLFVLPGDAVNLADTLECVAKDPKLRLRLMEGASRTASERLRWEKLVSDYWDEAYVRV